MAEKKYPIRLGITGGTGFIGTHLIAELNRSRDRYQVEIFDIERQDLFQPKTYVEFLKDKDVFIHLAGAMRESQDEIFRVNIFGTYCLLKGISDFNGSKPKVILSSSTQIYSTTEEPFWHDEQSQNIGLTPYGLSKLYAEETLKQFCIKGTVKGLALRFSNIYGPGGRPFYNSAVQTFLCQSVKKQKIVVNGTGNQGRDFLYVKDAINAILLAIDYEPDSFELFNICSGKLTTLNDILKSIKSNLGCDIEVEYNPGKEGLNFLIGDPQKAKNRLNFETGTPIEEGLRETFEWMKKTEI
ncbi:MAG: NAD-dependent epimerase/dehydratase family protein [Actinobacteria bacterium]|nr:NAD-dependent epimerase/dehydratase family protein [Actinomycetota bacterium]